MRTPRWFSGRSTKTHLIMAAAAFLVGLVATILIVREPMMPLTDESLRLARARWQAARIEDYDLHFRMHSSVYEIQVRRDTVVKANVNGLAPRGADVQAYSVEGLFDTLELELENLRDPHGPFTGREAAVIARVRFNNELGYVERYLRSSGGYGRGAAIEIIDFQRVTQEPSSR